MIIADTSVWVDYFRGQYSPETEFLDQQLNDDLVAIGDLILLEILQGFKSDRAYNLARKTLLLLEQNDFLGKAPALRAAENYRKLRKKGITIRKTNDVIIASYCIENKLSLLFSNRDFLPFAQHLGLAPALKLQGSSE